MVKVRTLRRLAFASLISVAALATAIPANAVSFQFHFNDANTGFTCGALAPPASAAQIACTGPIDDSIEWRLADPLRSGLELNDGFDAIITVGGGFVPISHLTHSNNVIGAPFQFAGSIHSDFEIRSSDGVTTFLAGTTDQPFDFLETLNREPCPEPNPNGSTCDDKFTLDLGVFVTPIKFTDANGVKYVMNFDLAENPANGTTICTVNGKFGICTDEGDIHGIDVLASIELMPMPEPGSIALLGIGLLGLFGASRKYIRKS